MVFIYSYSFFKQGILYSILARPNSTLTSASITDQPNLKQTRLQVRHNLTQPQPQLRYERRPIQVIQPNLTPTSRLSLRHDMLLVTAGTSLQLE